MTAHEFLQSKEPNVFIIPEEWLEEYANIVLNIAAEKAKIDMKKKSNYGKSRKWQKVKEDEVDLSAYEVMYFVDKNSILNCFIFYCGKLVVHL